MKKKTYWQYVKDKFDRSLMSAALTFGLCVALPIYAKINMQELGKFSEPKYTCLPLAVFSLCMLKILHKTYLEWRS